MPEMHLNFENILITVTLTVNSFFNVLPFNPTLIRTVCHFCKLQICTDSQLYNVRRTYICSRLQAIGLPQPTKNCLKICSLQFQYILKNSSIQSILLLPLTGKLHAQHLHTGVVDKTCYRPMTNKQILMLHVPVSSNLECAKL